MSAQTSYGRTTPIDIAEASKNTIALRGRYLNAVNQLEDDYNETGVVVQADILEGELCMLLDTDDGPVFCKNVLELHDLMV